VTIVHRRNDFRASQIMVQRALDHHKIEFLTPYVVDEVLGNGSVTGVRLRNTETGETIEHDAGGVFVAIGHEPNTKLFVDWLDHDENGYLVTKPGTTETNIPGVFAVGDVQDHIYRQAITAAGSGCMGALDAERYLAALEGHAGTAATAGLV
jgi:thioredoxin reductase (NADPH)